MMKTTMTKKDAIRIVLSDKKAWDTSLNYAIHYCKEALQMKEGSGAFRVQILYILNNIQYWRHPQAKEVREILQGNKEDK